MNVLVDECLPLQLVHLLALKFTVSPSATVIFKDPQSADKRSHREWTPMNAHENGPIPPKTTEAILDRVSKTA